MGHRTRLVEAATLASSTMRYHRNQWKLWIFIGFQWFLLIFNDFAWFSKVFIVFHWFLMILPDYCGRAGGSHGFGKLRERRLVSHCKSRHAHSVPRGAWDGPGPPIHSLRVSSIIIGNLSKKAYKNLCFVYFKKRQDYILVIPPLCNKPSSFCTSRSEMKILCVGS